ncbi:23S rRNA (guanosine(2251)-2'-O)-methyltransferase RlmB [Butyricicoccus porcorum]|uniref:23S rRNA (Guanosine(2251)-2'-O)-methyltransferase RlmB n=1 Tax=Butyricicoccus porcorum TaxID=1945634 RepID=A0A252F7R4_9FIRM|nr:23S rRNA (guanosine(2251)-2'-O)-methyltransferase RlmB [Butyricicoccus porcorum]MCI6925711.1 23S rRNA (guanosine(2251)-2'-O)-methyltransferase RlmB [Butyricicoccus porcorum]MDD6987801.1 23S rRNA (guanosine(2251)-2'-O)-methyltransferase RlmB [Butyricicoccus porcorum]OUM21807.1 23S rRNA (guanosine(2251)-2'-O)-methyltransferase RlmB [Butyricicoccus porcorum]
MSQKNKKTYQKRPAREEERETTLYEGRNAVMELLRAGRTVDKLFVAPDQNGRMADIIALAKKSGAVVTQVDRRKLDAMSETGVHQGVIAQAAAHEYVSIDDILQVARDRGEQPLILVCDGLTDPHNLGAVIRSAETAGAHGVVIPKRRSVGLTATAAKASAGAIEHIGVARVTNLAAAIDELKENGVWVFGADAGGDKQLYEADFAGAAAIVIGSEGNGLSRIVHDKCDFIVSIPMKGKVNSLNASAAAAVLLYEAVRQRLGEERHG